MHRPKKYDPVGRCIYCGKTSAQTRLSSEHIIPLSFGANHELLEASCDECAKITSYVEGYCANEVFKMVRVQHAVPRKRRKNKITTKLPILESFGSDPRTAPETMVPVADHPSFLFLPVLPPPRILTGPVQLPDVGYWFRPVVEDSDACTKRLTASGKQGVKLYGQIKLGVFARMLAKIAHTYAVARLGLDGFKPLLIEEILVGKEPANLVGGPPNPVREARADSNLVEIEFVRVSSKEYVVVWIWLFAYLGTPMYGAVAGEALPHTPRDIR